MRRPFSALLAGAASLLLATSALGQALPNTSLASSVSATGNRVLITQPSVVGSTQQATPQAVLHAGAGGIEASAPTAHSWISYVDLTDVAHYAQPSFADLSGALSASQLGSQAANTFPAGPTSGAPAAAGWRALVGSDLPAPGLASLGGVDAIAQNPHQWIAYLDTAGLLHQSQPAFSDLSGTIALGQFAPQSPDMVLAGACGGSSAPPTFRALCGSDLPAPTTGSLGGVQATAPAAHQFLTGLGTGGVFTQAQPAFGDLSGTIALSQFAAQSPDQVLAGPCGGSAAAPTFRGLCGADMPTFGGDVISSLVSGVMTLTLTNTSTARADIGLGALATPQFAGLLLNGSGCINLAVNGSCANAAGSGWDLIGANGANALDATVSYAGYGGLVTTRYDGAAAAPTAVAAADQLRNDAAQAYDGTSTGNACQFSTYALDAWTTTDHSGLYRVYCAGPNSTTGQTAFDATQWGLGIGNVFGATATPNAMLDIEQAGATYLTTDTATLGSATALGTIATTATMSAMWPKVGAILIDQEEMFYVQASSTSLTITARGVFGTSGAVHACGSNCTIAAVLVNVSKNTSSTPYYQQISTGSVAIDAIPPAPTSAVGVTLPGEQVVGAAPTLTGFGTGATDALATKASGDVIVGSSPGTTGNIGFPANSYINKPTCQVSRQNGGAVSWSVSTTGISVTTSAAMTAGEDISYICRSHG